MSQLKKKTLYSRLHASENFLMRSWWVVLFVLATYFCYEHGLRNREIDYAKLNQQYQDLLREKSNALAQQEDLKMQINSQSDPDWMEITLMEGLGLVPEGQTKVVFMPPTGN